MDLKFNMRAAITDLKMVVMPSLPNRYTGLVTGLIENSENSFGEFLLIQTNTLPYLAHEKIQLLNTSFNKAFLIDQLVKPIKKTKYLMNRNACTIFMSKISCWLVV